MEGEATEFIEQTLGTKLSGSFHDALKSGVVLCHFRSCPLQTVNSRDPRQWRRYKDNFNAMNLLRRASISIDFQLDCLQIISRPRIPQLQVPLAR